MELRPRLTIFRRAKNRGTIWGSQEVSKDNRFIWNDGGSDIGCQGMPTERCRKADMHCGANNIFIRAGIRTGAGHYQAIGIGLSPANIQPLACISQTGLSQHPSHSDTLEAIGMQQVPTVLDADVLNHVAVITPHPGEYQRLFGDQADPADMSRKYGVYIILKGHQTSVNTPEGRMYINQSGNPRMATAGSGDVLTGILTGLLARGYPVDDAARLGVFLHGLAGELAAQKYGQESLIASDIIDQLPEAFLSLQKSQEMGTGL